MTYQTRNPSTETIEKIYSSFTKNQIENELTKLNKQFLDWKKTSIESRRLRLQILAILLRNNEQAIAHLISKEMGKPISESLAEVQKCQQVCCYYSELQMPLTESVVFEPTGIILGIMPWNFPLWQVFRFAIPTLLSGNVVLLKHAPNVPQCAHWIHALFIEANIPLANAFIEVADIESVIADSRVTGVSFTGSVRAGASVASLAGKYIKPCVLELGGSDPFIICKDADLDAASDAAIKARLLNNGQTCIAAKRFIVHKSFEKKFIQNYLDRLSKKVIGDPLLETTDIGPLARADIRENLQRQLDISIKRGAKKWTVPFSIPKTGFFFEPCLLNKLKKDMPVVCEETFGPIAVVLPFDTIGEAITLANDTPYGLGASIWTETPSTAAHMAQNIQAGNIAINQTVSSQFHLPFGGTKLSGFGRELGQYGLSSFCNIKTIVD